MSNPIYPAAADIQPPVDTDDQQSNFADWLDACKQMFGGQPVATLTIASGNITPDLALNLKVDTEAALNTDDLDHALLTNFPQAGRFLLLRAADTARTVVVRHNIAGDGKFLLANGANFSLDDDKKAILFTLEGTSWIEVTRFFGADVDALIAYYGLGTVVKSNIGTTLAQTPAQIPSIDQVVGDGFLFVDSSSMKYEVGQASAPTPVTKRFTPGGPYEENLSFSNAIDQEAFFKFPSPKSYTGGPMKVRAIYYHEGGQTPGLDGVVFTIGLLSRAHDESLAVGYVEGDCITDAANANRVLISSEPSITPNTATANSRELILGRVRRQLGHASDDMNIPAILMGLEIRYPRNKPNET